MEKIYHDKNTNVMFLDRDDENLNRFMHDVRKHKMEPLTQDEEISLIIKVKSGDKFESERAIEKLVNCNQCYLISLAKRYSTNENFLDIVQEANYGFIKAIMSYNVVDVTARLTTYALQWILGEINKYLRDSSNFVGQKNKSKTFTKVNRVKERFFAQNGRYPTTDELFDILNEQGLNISHKDDIEEINIISLDRANDSEVDNDMPEFQIGDEDENFEKIDKDIMKVKIAMAIKSLSDIEQKIISKTFGIGCIESSDGVIALELGISEYKVSAYREKALNKMKENKIINI